MAHSQLGSQSAGLQILHMLKTRLPTGRTALLHQHFEIGNEVVGPADKTLEAGGGLAARIAAHDAR